MPVELFFREYGEPTNNHTVLILHGIFGMSDNWHTIAKQLSRHFRVIVPDLRNHGYSPHTDEFDFEVMAEDILHLIDKLNINPDHLHIAGHSMGGKLAMWIALKTPLRDKIKSITIIDIGPEATEPKSIHLKIIDIMQEIEQKSAQNPSLSRKDIQKLLESHRLPQHIVFFLNKNLKLENGKWKWKVNWHSIKQNYHKILQAIQAQPSSIPALAILGEKSEYVSEDTKKHLKALFPQIRIVTIKNAGHWIHAEQPQIFFEVWSDFLLMHTQQY